MGDGVKVVAWARVENGEMLALTCAGPNSACNQGLILLSDHERVVDGLTADRDSWEEQASQRVADWDEMRKRAESAERRLAVAEGLLRACQRNGWGHNNIGDLQHPPLLNRIDAYFNEGANASGGAG